MSLTIADIEHVAMLARISLSQEEKEYYMQELTAVFGYIEQLKEVDTDDVDETVQVTGLEDVVRDDEVAPYNEDMVADIQSQFPDKMGHLLKVSAVFNRK
ncbi:Asp-tRNA(Asn)/Glu-tRNA(Gln) amidotransferase subunit GatC [Patescibacteria group bacterium]|nr:Asp-tRNA(Asn)/Glu-tRNA(Gln) amidotransferase subunit GatC [Patescibacteria group bacterium]MBU1721388.1 Asp-tRNA(Asn)/Glu-tRNA(Gln) amidotransferase subunit GatC [Patescibacteria group bacterium]MBU1900758.1 Asp-tRNA(Asn)/Glu-tRNA(Gln) amidotransferase subunit GatC [Patescibacteria group bacterium]